MQINGQFAKSVRKVRGIWVALLFAIVGLAFVGFGVYSFISPNNDELFEVATATIQSVESEMIGDEENFYVIISYTDKNNVEHTNIRFNGYSSSWRVGDEITIKYNTNDPTDVRSNVSPLLMPIILVVVGSCVAIFSIYSLIKSAKSGKRKEDANFDENQTASATAPHNVVDTKLFFHYTGKLSQSYIVEDKLNQSIYEIKLAKFNPLGANQYEFIDSQKGYHKMVKVSKTITSSSSGFEMPFVGDTLSSSFKIDGVNCWQYLANRKYEIKHLLEGKTFIKYEILKDGKTVANIYPANIKDPFNEDSKNFLRMGKGVYRLEIINAELEDIVMAAFIITKTDIVE